MTTLSSADPRVPVPVLAMGLVLALGAAACGTDGVEVEEPVPTLFTEETSTTDPDPPEESTTTTSTIPVAERLPPLADDVAGALRTPTGIVVPILARTEAGWLVRTPCGGDVELAGGTEIGAQHVVIDPGHGGEETGAVGEGGLRESELNLAVAERAAAILAADGIEVLMTRDSDVRITLATRTGIARAVGALAFVSIHHNADPDGPSEGPGAEVWYQLDDPESRRLSGLIHEEVVAALEPYDVEWVADDDAGVKYRLNQRGTDYYGILRESAGVPAALAELAFISNPAEEALLATDDFRDVEAVAVARAVVRQLVTDDAGSGFVEPYDRVEPAGSGGGASGCVDPALG